MQPTDLHRNPTASQQISTGIQQAASTPAQESNRQPADQHRNPKASQHTCTGIQKAASRPAQEYKSQPPCIKIKNQSYRISTGINRQQPATRY
jgi:nitrate reductase cytochrome c-type subunit